jgi:uncharacterized protein YndB with AHSA1/START domain
MTQSKTETQQGLVIERVLDAPREKVWDAWTNPEQVKKWWGPKDFTAPSIRSDFREGGTYLWAMQGPDGQVYWSTGTFREIVPHERLVVTDSFADEKGNVVPASHYGMPGDFPLEMEVVVTFEDVQDGKTKLTLRHGGMPAGTEEGAQAEAGWNQTLDKLEALLTE